MKRYYDFVIYLAGADIEPQKLTMKMTPARHFLYSYHMLRNQAEHYIRELKALKEKYPDMRLFLDSGAFSAFMQNDTIDLTEYIDFVKADPTLWNVVTGLDIIGEMSGEATWENCKRMEAAGITVMPTYHMGEDFKVLDRIAENYEFYALGGAASSDLGREAQNKWLDSAWARWPAKRVHGFGFFRYEALVKYPWASVDSTAWLNARRYGMIIHPEGSLMRAEHMGIDPDMPFTNTLISVENMLKLQERVNNNAEGNPIVEGTLPGL
jgi:hypothetical protein